MKKLDFYTTAQDSPWLFNLTFDILKKVDPVELQFKINRFRNLDFKSLSSKAIKSELSQILQIEVAPETSIFGLNYLYKVLLKGNRFFRVRKFKDRETLLREISSESSCWNPPSKFVKTSGRLNKPHESLLYTAQEPSTAIKELKIQEEEYFVLISYISTEPMTVWYIAPEFDHIRRFVTDRKIIEIHNLLLSFLVDLFTMDIGEGQEYYYKITEQIGREWFSSSDRIKGWKYPSVRDRTKYNICFDPKCFEGTSDFKKKLRMNGALVCKSTGDIYYDVENIFTAFDQKGVPILREIDTDYSVLAELGLEAHFSD